MNTLWTRAHKISEPATLEEERTYLKTVLLKNGYSNSAINRVLKRSVFEPTRRKKIAEENTNTRRAFLPYIGVTTHRIGRVLRKAGVGITCSAPNKLGSFLRREKDKLPTLDTAGVYEVPCSCGKVYVGETGRTISIRRSEHIRQCRLQQWEQSAIAQHAMETHHEVLFDDIKLLARESKKPHRRVREAIEIARRPHNFNRDVGVKLYDGWRYLFQDGERTKMIGSLQPNHPDQ